MWQVLIYHKLVGVMALPSECEWAAWVIRYNSSASQQAYKKWVLMLLALHGYRPLYLY